MAGGSDSRSGDRGSIVERLNLGRYLPGPADDGGGRGRVPVHCWVRDAPGLPGRIPGLLLEWRQVDGVWRGRVVIGGGEDRLRPVVLWVPGECLGRAE